MLPKKMKAAVLHEFGKPLSIEEVPVKPPKDNEVVVKVVACGVCHSDVHAANGEWPIKPKMPLIMGHESIGYVAAIGADVKNLKEGDVVGIPWLNGACNCCHYCGQGRSALCVDQQNSGYTVDGGYAEYVTANAAYVARFPQGGFNFTEMAPVLCAGITVYKGLKVSGLNPGEWVGISGIGGLGHLAVQYAKALGYRVAAIDVDDSKLALAKEVGADITVNASKQSPDDFLKKEIGGVHGMLVTAVVNEAFSQTLRAIRPGGTMTMAGIPDGALPVSVFDACMGEIIVRGTLIGTRTEMQEAIELALQGKVRTRATGAKLEDINDILPRLHQGKITGRVVLEISDPL
ncbi:zinc-dependent alcohol dehydrogenase [Paraflavitalea sp. CAU 1676]|uniref:zinc-dependent alcohol dehydrogenase n=1 Tax=Paraflavitalea sp. CAU 1676 TaxID=3032598 RepID=UPI0023DC7004|nr:zinc-dependent alcohol dehydrogenase [Paraflavitalea sp. CAU 1676]MDF2187932.1 zinc-dependent alcohol dehydrogenase [Paraflavitalea sp. CAU 1676]